MPVQRLTRTIMELLPEGLGEDLRRNVQAAVRGAFERMDLVTREEFDVQSRVLQRTRGKLETLEQQVAELERRLEIH